MKTVGRSKEVLLVFGFAVLMAFASSAAAQVPSAGDAGLQPGDVVQITVWQREELSGEFTVAPDGSLYHPLYRQVRVTGIPVSQVEERVRSFLSAYEANPQIVVQPLYHVAISGPVMRPDIYALPPGTTVAQAVTRAGGVTEGGKRDDVSLIREGREIKVDLTGAEAMRMPVQSGDQILVAAETSGGGIRGVILPAIQIATSVAHLIYLANR